MSDFMQIKDYPNYWAHIDGSIHSFYFKRPKILKPSTSNGHYKQIVLYKDEKGKSVNVHRVIAETFLDNPHKKEQINHIDGNKLNNKVSNLEWVTRIENARHSREVLGYVNTSLRKYPKCIIGYCKELIRSGYNNKPIEKITGIPSRTVSKVKAGIIYKEVI